MKPHDDTFVLKGKVGYLPLKYFIPTCLLLQGHVGFRNHFEATIKADYIKIRLYIFTFMLTLKAPTTTAFINTFHCFSEKIRLDISCESSARHRIHMTHQALFP